MFKDCKTGGYNLEKTQASEHRLNSLILLIALAYSCAILQGQQIKRKGIQNYIGRLKEFQRSLRRHSSFWIGLYGQSWVIGMEFFQEIVNELMLLRRNKLPFFSEGVKGYVLDFINLLTGLSPRQLEQPVGGHKFHEKTSPVVRLQRCR
ncbi:MAG: hypothetical protein ACKPGC_06430 [Planktothrix sp.]|uniref:hypothetical protein n=1 Tax=Planktothrix sp. TaxID=3088171 RepID=UPI0038D40340